MRMIIHAPLDNGQAVHARVRDARLHPAVLARGIQPLGPLLVRREFLVVEAAAA